MSYQSKPEKIHFLQFYIYFLVPLDRNTKAEKTVEGKLQPFDETMIINKLTSISLRKASQP